MVRKYFSKTFARGSYLRLLHNTYDFIDNYVENLRNDKSIKYEHKLKWNEIVSQQVSEC